MCKPRSKSLRHAGRIEVQVARKTCAGKLTPCRLWPLVGVECLSLWGVSVSCSHALLRLAASLLTLSARRLCGASEETLFFFARGILAVVGLLARSRAPPLSFFNRCLHRHGLPGSGGSRASSPWTTWLGWAAWFRGFELSRVVRARPCMHQRAVRSVGVGSSIAFCVAVPGRTRNTAMQRFSASRSLARGDRRSHHHLLRQRKLAGGKIRVSGKKREIAQPTAPA